MTPFLVAVFALLVPTNAPIAIGAEGQPLIPGTCSRKLRQRFFHHDLLVLGDGVGFVKREGCEWAL